MFVTCESVHEGGQGPGEHLEERISAGILLRSTQHRVLQDVRDSGAVHGGRSQLDAARQQQVEETSNFLKDVMQAKRENNTNL